MPPLLYLVRHAHALDDPDDAARTLSSRGRAEVMRLARWLQPSAAFEPAKVWYSPLVRARETAELLLAELGLAVRRTERAELVPDADPALAAKALGGETKPLALFGHEPHLSALASLLVTGAASPVVFTFRKGTVLALEPVGHGRWAVRWQLSPDLFG